MSNNLNLIDRKISRISLVVYFVLLILATTLMCVPGGALAWYIFMLPFTLFPIITGPKYYRIVGIVALVFTGFLCIKEYKDGKEWQRSHFDNLRQQKDLSNVENHIE